MKTRRSNGWALLPLALFVVLYVVTFVATGSLQEFPVSIAFLLTAVTALALSSGSITSRVQIFCRGAANDTILLMVVIFVLAGAFAGSAKAVGADTATVNMVLRVLPENIIPASIFIAACFISMSMGTSCGTIAALSPVAMGLAPQIGMSLPEMMGIVVGGAMFGDNLSFISDTTIVATRTQGVRMKDKFRTNIRIVLPVALLVTAWYVWKGLGLEGAVPSGEPIDWLKIIPYLVVLVTALAGVNVIVVLLLGIGLSGVAGLTGGDFTVWQWAGSANAGIVGGMGELIIVTLMAGGLFEVIRHNGGIDWLVERLTRRIRSRRTAEGSIAALTVFTDCCTANNTITLIIVGPIARNIGTRFGIDPCRTASLLDTVSCFAQGLLPYGAQLLMAAGPTAIDPMSIIPYLYYPMALGLASIAVILLRRRK